MKKFLTVAISVIATCVAAPAVASADRGEVGACATSHEFSEIHFRSPRSAVDKILDGDGRHSTVKTSPAVAQREYRICGRRWEKGRVIVRYTRDTQTVQAAVWLWVSRGTLD